MTQHEIKAESSGKAPSVQPTCAGLGLAGRARAPLPLLGGVRLGMRRDLSPPASLPPRSVPEAHPYGPGLTQGLQELVEVLAAAHLPGTGEVGHAGGGGCGDGGGKVAGALGAAQPRLRSVPSARPESPRKRPPPGALQPRPRPRLPGPCPAGAQPLCPYCALAIRSPGCRPGTRSPPVGGGGTSATPQATPLKVDGGRGLEETRFALRGNCGIWAVGIWRSFIPFSALL